MSDVSGKAVGRAVVEQYRELTPAAVILGIIQGIILNLAFVYAALKLGFSIGGSTVASIMGYALLRGVLRKGTMIENNINQTIASGINTAGTGIVFTLPALFMLDAKWKAEGLPGIEFSPWPLLFGGVAGAILGVVLIIPLRKQMIDLDRLRFPSGVAVATIIRSGSTGSEKAVLLGIGFLISALWKLVMDLGWLDVPGILEHEELNISLGFLPDYVSPVLYLSLMNIAAGLLSGRGGLPFFVGGMLAWWVISPIAVAQGWVPADGITYTMQTFAAGSIENGTPGFIYGKMIRPLGIGTLIGGALMGVVMSFPAIKSAIVSLATAAKTAKAGGGMVGGDEMPLKVLVGGVIGAVAMFFIASLLTPGVTVGQAILSAVVGTLWLGLAGLIVAQATGMTDISPMSGMALISVTLMMFLLDMNIAAAMVVGVAVCVAIGQGADMMQDLKTGFLIGGRPNKQQIAQFSVTWIGALLAMGAIYVLWTAGPNGQGGFGPGSDLPAPQAGALMGIIDGIKSGNVPIDKYTIGGIVGLMLGAAPMAGLGVLVGLAMYLPFSITLGYGLGCLGNMALMKTKGAAFCEHKLVPLAAGLIVGEALMGIGLAAYDIFHTMGKG
ncbi:MAG: OPT/YSL family transporter [Myxococcales bacterium]|nr:OPT/YSL family transporter [Myxococcales bacterium]MCB9541432.1 OPT/YSL family transporter [Myxococcales bacterium]MCB9552068.1 OPT/YSL family transporter [Myxococcales bacterium]